jgi:hypothetical protein
LLLEGGEIILLMWMGFTCMKQQFTAGPLIALEVHCVQPEDEEQGSSVK